MKMKKTILILATTSTIFAFGSQSVNINASTWHKGTPNTLHGKYKTHKFGADLVETLNITSTKMEHLESGMPSQDGHNVSYKVVGKNKYTIKYDAPAMGLYKGGKNLKITLIKSGNNIRIPHGSHVFYKY